MRKINPDDYVDTVYVTKSLSDLPRKGIYIKGIDYADGRPSEGFIEVNGARLNMNILKRIKLALGIILNKPYQINLKYTGEQSNERM